MKPAGGTAPSTGRRLLQQGRTHSFCVIVMSVSSLVVPNDHDDDNNPNSVFMCAKASVGGEVDLDQLLRLWDEMGSDGSWSHAAEKPPPTPGCSSESPLSSHLPTPPSNLQCPVSI